MHDSAVVQAIIENVEEQADGTIERVELEVGELSEFDAAHIVEHLKELVHWHVRAIQTPSVIECPGCGYKGRPMILERDHDYVCYTCPECNQKPNIISGDQIKIKKIQYKA